MTGGGTSDRVGASRTKETLTKENGTIGTPGPGWKGETQELVGRIREVSESLSA